MYSTLHTFSSGWGGAVPLGAAVPPPGPSLHCTVQVRNEKRQLESELGVVQHNRAARQEEVRSPNTELQALSVETLSQRMRSALPREEAGGLQPASLMM